VGLAWHEGTPVALVEFTCRMMATGIGDPALFNDEVISRGLRDHGVSAEDSFDYMNSTCVEIKPAGASNIWVTAPYFNCPKALLEVMDRLTADGCQEPATFAELKDLVKRRLAETVAAEARNLDAVWRRRGETGCFPLASCLIKDCLERGQDFDRGGARYNWVENSFVGLANLVDGLAAVEWLVFITRELSLRRFNEIVKSNFQGHEGLRAKIVNQLPCYGTDHEEADRLAVEMAEFLEDATESNTVGLHRYVPGFFCWIVHEAFGSATGATPDGRRAGFPFADGAGASQGRERRGPTASILSTTKWNHRRALGGLVQNVRFSGSTFRSAEDLTKLRHLLETFLRRGGFEIQVNVAGSETLRDAQCRPEQYRDLLIRVAGYSDYFVHLNRNMQEEVIARTEH
jgi:trans-4-hydroxy-L-proline dehydratase